MHDDDGMTSHGHQLEVPDALASRLALDIAAEAPYEEKSSGIQPQAADAAPTELGVAAQTACPRRAANRASLSSSD